MRNLFPLLATAAAYAFLRGWPEELHPLLRACFAVLTLVLGFGLWNRRGARRPSRARPARPPGVADYLAMGLGVLAGECLFLFFLAAAPPRADALALALEERLRPEAAAVRKTGLEASGTGDGPAAGNWLWDSRGRRPLPNELAARPTDKPEVFLRPDDRPTALHLLASRPYVRAFALEEFRDSAWSAPSVAAAVLSAGPDGRISFPQAAARPGPRLAYHVFHAADPLGQDVLTVLQGVHSVELPRLRRIAPGIVRLDPLPTPGTGYEYHAVSQPLDFDTLVAAGSLTAVAPSSLAPAHLKALPENAELRDDLLGIAVRTQGPLEQRLAALRRFLHRNCTYSLTISNPDRLDPVQNFLFHERRGHCEFFATAGALLARSLGIPSRVAYGWTGGRWFEGQGLLMFRAREAHAWTELYFEETGWVVFDTTPPGALDAARASIAAPGEQAPLGDDALLALDDETASGSLGPWPWAALATGFGLLAIAGLVLRFRRRPPRLADPDSTRLLPDPPRYLARFKRVTASHGHPMPAARTLRQHLRELRGHGLEPAFARDLLDYHYATTYAEAAPDKSRERRLDRAIAAWRPR